VLSIKKALARRAVAKTAKHSARGTASKLKREPLRAGTLLAVGCAMGALGAWLLLRAGSPGAATADSAGP
jgi:hypothetical protein